jgi:hypothetical protein
MARTISDRKTMAKTNAKANEPRFVTGQPAVMAGDSLVISDLHVGVEYGFYKSGIRIPSNTQGLLGSIRDLIAATGAKKLVLLGDVKHKVPGSTFQEMREMPEFLSELCKRVEVDIVPGNHDSDLKKFVPEGVTLQPSNGFRRDDYFFVHGHSWPDSGFLDANYVFVGHEHPQIEFRDGLGHRFFEQVWMRAEFDREKLSEKYDDVPSKLPELIIVPKFNKLSGGISMNYPLTSIEREHRKFNSGIGPLVRTAKLKSAKIYLLDGTFLGRLTDLY